MVTFPLKMKYFAIQIICLAAFTLLSVDAVSQRVNVKKIFRDVETQTSVLIDNIGKTRKGNDELVMPRTVENGNLKLVKSTDWTSGFFPGILWYIFLYTGDNVWRERADSFTQILETEKYNSRTHDMGFKIFCSYGTGYLFTKDEYYKGVIIEAARTLVSRFNKNVGAIKSWDHSQDKWEFPVIIDNMMNLELLLAATRYSGDSSFYKIAIKHANTTLRDHYRPDKSSYHVVDYDSLTGEVRKKNTHQGYSNESSWVRGQAWGLYSFTMCYEETRMKHFLLQADAIANYLINHPKMTRDLIPYWDFDDPSIPNTFRDASAATVIAAGLLRLSKFSKNSRLYRKVARRILYNLTKNYRSPIGENKGFILLHSTGHAPANSEIDVPIIYTDYYYLEGLLRLSKKL